MVVCTETLFRVNAEKSDTKYLKALYVDTQTDRLTYLGRGQKFMGYSGQVLEQGLNV